MADLHVGGLSSSGWAAELVKKRVLEAVAGPLQAVNNFSCARRRGCRG